MRESIVTSCAVCGRPLTIISFAGVTAGECDHCQTVEARTTAKKLLADTSNLAWRKLTANFSAYLDTDFNRLPCPEQSTQALAWDGKHGLNLWGPPATGKTRTLLLVLKSAHDQGRSIKVFGPSDFSASIVRKRYEAAGYIKWLRDFDLLAFDDLGKVRLTPIQEGYFFGLLESFFAQGKPVFTTHNYDAKTLQRKFANGEALVSKIRRHCQSIHFPTP